VRSTHREAVATAVVFSTTGLVSATWAARIPATQSRLHLSTSEVALAVLSIEAGALLGLPAGGMLVTRRGGRWTLRLGFAVYPVMMLPIAVMPSLSWLAVALAVWAAANSVIDVAMNATGARLEARTTRPLLSRLHAAQSAGLFLGGLLATVAAALNVPLAAHFGAVAVAGAVCGLAAIARLDPDTASPPRRSAGRPNRQLALLGAVAFCAFLIDGAASNWAAVDMRAEQHASTAVAAATYTSFIIAVAVIRLRGDRLIARFERANIVRVSGLTATIGAVTVILAPGVIAAITGWIVVGAGLALLAPTILGAASSAAKLPTGPAIAAVTTLGYLGSFTGPPLIGALSGPLTLSGAIVLVAVAAATTTLLAPVALPRR
jgi:MFS family permease